PRHVLANGEAGISLRESKGDVVAQAIVSQEDLEVLYLRMAIEIVRAPSGQNALMAFGKDTVKSHHCHPLSNGVVIDQFRISKDRGTNTEELVYLLGVLKHLNFKFITWQQAGK